MKASIRDKTVLQSIEPDELTSYLQAQDWQRESYQPEKSSTWIRHSHSTTYEILVPLSRSFRDYPVRLAEVLETLETAENRSQFLILADIQSVRSDVIKIGIEGEYYQHGSMPFQEGVKFIQQAYDLLFAAACSAVRPQEVIPARKPARAVGYMQTVKLGQSEAGSYIITLHSPIYSRGTSPQSESSRPFERLVTRTLFQAVERTIDVAEASRQTGLVEKFREVVSYGVSANLCEALVGLQKETASDRVKLYVNWSPVQGIEEGLTRQLIIPAELAPIIQEAAQYLNELALNKIEEYTLWGKVEALEGDMNSGGVVKIRANIPYQTGTRLVRVKLSREDYEKAYAAHGGEHFVSVRGTLTKEGRFYYLNDPGHFIIQSHKLT